MSTFKSAIGAFAREFAIEQFWDKAVQAVRNYIQDTTPTDIQSMVKSGAFPALPPHIFRQGHQYQSFIEHISEVRLMEAIMEARPDIGQAIMDLGYPGAEYIVKLRLHLLDLVHHPEKAAARAARPDLVTARCDQCGSSWPVQRGAAVAACPFCGK